jgi:molybdate transport system substrate-binding protein
MSAGYSNSLSRCSLLLALALLPLAPVFAAEELIVSAAASLSNAFADIAKIFEAKHPDDKIILNFAASDVLLKQIEQGAPVDVFASADEITMDRAASAQRIDVSTRTDFAGNTLVLIVANGATQSPKNLNALQSESFRHIALGNPASVPAGRYAQAALSEQNLWQPLQAKLVLAQNVRQALDYVARREADAGFVYATDAATQSENVHIALPVPSATAISYAVAMVSASGQPVLAHEFIATLKSTEAQAILKRYGFSLPN